MSVLSPLLFLLIMQNELLSASFDTLSAAQNITPEDAFALYQLADIFQGKNDCCSPSDFSDYIERESGISDYFIATIVLDGGIDALIEDDSEDFKDKGDHEVFVQNLRFVDGILWGKYLLYKSLERTLPLRQNS